MKHQEEFSLTVTTIVKGLTIRPACQLPCPLSNAGKNTYGAKHHTTKQTTTCTANQTVCEPKHTMSTSKD